MKVRLQQYNDSVYYESLTADPELDGIRDFFTWFSKNYQTGKIKLDITEKNCNWLIYSILLVDPDKSDNHLNILIVNLFASH